MPWGYTAPASNSLAEGAVVVDCGARTVKAGTAREAPASHEPCLEVPAAVRLAGGGGPAHPLAGGVVRDWDRLEAIWHYVFYDQLGWVQGEEGAVMVAESPFSSRASREQLTQILFEKFNVAGLFMAETGPLALYAMGKTSGLAVDFGYTGVGISPVVEGQTYRSGTVRLANAGGKAQAAKLLELLAGQPGCEGLGEADAEAILRACGEYASPGAPREEAAEAASVELPDGRVVAVGSERWRCRDHVFRPPSEGSSAAEPALAEAVVSGILAVDDRNVRSTVAENIVLCGGGSTCPSLEPVFQKEVQRRAPMPLSNVSVLQKPNYMPDNTNHYAAWTGAAILAKTVFNQNQHVSKFDYDESGPTVVFKKCGL